MADDPRVLLERLRMTFRLHDEGVRLMRQSLRRRHPDASDEEIERLLGEWLSERPGAEFGDAVGRPVPWPRA